jgi:GNAT superfamily N-acetyltransferase
VSTLRIERLGGRDRLSATSSVLQRARRADPTGGVWDAADVQWWWRRPRATDDLDLPVWFDEAGPCAAVDLTAWDDAWQLDALTVPGTVEPATVWRAALDEVDPRVAPTEGLVRDGDAVAAELLAAAGFHATDDSSGTTWMDAADAPPVAPVPTGYRILDRAQHGAGTHPMANRNGPDVEARLRETDLYDPCLDLCVRADDGTTVGYALYWLDPVTGVGMLEPMRVEDAHQRRGLARALLTEGLRRLVDRGAERLKVGFDGEAGRALYLGAGFVLDSMAVAWRR